MKPYLFQIEAITLGLTLFCISGLKPAYAADAKGSAAKAGAAAEAGNSAKSAPAAYAAKSPTVAESHTSAPNAESAAAAEHTQAVAAEHEHAAANVASKVSANATAGEGTGAAPTGSELTGSQLTGSQLTGFTAGFGNTSFTASQPPALASESSDIERAQRRSSSSHEEPTQSQGVVAPVGKVDTSDTASPVSAFHTADIRERLAQTDYDAALTRVRARLNQNDTYQQALTRQTKESASPTTSPSADSGNVAAAKTIAELESRAITADPEANAAKEKLDEAVLARAAAERTQAAPHATANASRE